jgi:hypothetical protein
LTVSTTPLLLCALLPLAVERFRVFALLRLWGLRFVPLPLEADDPLLEREALLRLRVVALLWLCGLRFVPLPLEPDDPLLARDALLRLRVEAADFERDEPLELPDVFRLLVLPEADLPVAIQTLPQSREFLSRAGYPSVYAVIALFRPKRRSARAPSGRRERPQPPT